MIATNNRKASLACLPTFLGIGSMRCGSTWLCEVLRRHPEVRIGDRKEMDFLFMPRMLEYDLNWYAQHFKPMPGEDPRPVRGEISPRYARLKAWQVRHIAELLPDLRIILTLRHPIQRAWSQALYDFGRLQSRDIRTIGSFEFLRQLERSRSRLSSDYPRMIKIWASAFKPDAIYIDFFDRVKEDPESYMNDVLRHIGASVPFSLPADLVERKIWDTTSLVKHEREIPEIVEWYIASRLLKGTEELNAILDGRVSHWVNEIRIIRGRTRPSWRLLKEVNRVLFGFSERIAYEAYHAILDIRLWKRWRQLRRSYSAASPFSAQTELAAR